MYMGDFIINIALRIYKKRSNYNTFVNLLKQLLLTTPTLGNICQVCDERIQIFHRLDDGGHDSCSDVEIEVVENTNEALPMRLVDTIPDGDFVQRTQRPETPVIVDDDDMLFNIFMQKFDRSNLS